MCRPNSAIFFFRFHFGSTQKPTYTYTTYTAKNEDFAIIACTPAHTFARVLKFLHISLPCFYAPLMKLKTRPWNFDDSAPLFLSPFGIFDDRAIFDAPFLSPPGNFDDSAPSFLSPLGNFDDRAIFDAPFLSPPGNFDDSAPSFLSPLRNFDAVDDFC